LEENNPKNKVVTTKNELLPYFKKIEKIDTNVVITTLLELLLKENTKKEKKTTNEML